MKSTLRLALGSLFLAAASLHAALDIVPKGDDPTFLVLKNTDTGEVLGTFWDRSENEEAGESDYGFESSAPPSFLWSPDRKYVAVTFGAPRFQAATLYLVTGNSLKEVTIPSLTAEQAAELDAVDEVASGTEPVRWQTDGTLLLRFWKAPQATSDTEEPKIVSIWADVEVSGDTAKIAGTSSMEPSAPPAGMFPNPAPPAGETLASTTEHAADPEAPAPAGEEEAFTAERLVGTHPVSGKNPNGSSYEGTVEIRVANGIVGMEWRIGDSVSHGNGALVGQTLGIALDDGIAIYRLVGQSEGQSLIGAWSSADSTVTNHESILIGNADMTQANFPAEEINGKYVSLREVPDGQVEGTVFISGGEIAKKVLWKTEEETTKCQGLALGEGFATLTPTGISVFEKHLDDSGNMSLVGTAVSREGKTQSESLSPAN